MSNSKSRKIRQLMAQTGMNYTKAALELDRQEMTKKANLAIGYDDVAEDSVLSNLTQTALERAGGYGVLGGVLESAGLAAQAQEKAALGMAQSAMDRSRAEIGMIRGGALESAALAAQAQEKAALGMAQSAMDRATACPVRFIPPA